MKTSKKGYTLIELLVVVGVIALLLGIFIPALERAKEQAKIVTVNSELNGIAFCLESYSMTNKDEFPPTRAECSADKRYLYSLPQELVDAGYLPEVLPSGVGSSGSKSSVRFADIEDRYNRGYTYKYIAIGFKLDYYGSPSKQHFYVPEGFPENKDDAKLIDYSDITDSPIVWTLFSLGPRYDMSDITKNAFPITKGFPVKKDFWYSFKKRKGILTRVKLRYGEHIGSFEAAR